MRFINFILSSLLLTAISVSSSFAAKPSTIQKPRVVLMPIKVSEEDRSLSGSMETALVEGLQDRYTVFSGERVQQKAREIFTKESKTAKAECDETKCMEDIAIAFQAELIAVANVTKRPGGYFLAISIQNIFDNKVVYSKSLPCKGSDEFEMIEKLKELSGMPVQTQSIKVNTPKLEVQVAADIEDKQKNEAAAKIKAENAKDVFIDKETGLMWQDDTEAKTVKKDWQGALDYCQNLTLADYDDWRLGKSAELLSLYTQNKFLKNQPDYTWLEYGIYWSNTEYISDFTKAWVVLFQSGGILDAFKKENSYVRCVRDNK